MTETTLPNHLYKVFKLIPLGMTLPISATDLALHTHSDVRTVRENIRKLIIDYGIPICSNRDTHGGYYIPQNDTERLAGVLPLQRQQNEEYKRINALLSADLNDWRKYRNV
ncbi:hypothetical protein [Streptococcus suis]|uniref:hypothetical protein n=1 Tax=Streptococcus suis TaxID=1307 RepID=UPI0006B696AA|nr:hypothetical protein [Streptococcus suis]AZR98211.1 hypothetical protein A7J10_10415 [Streptococcus suis]KPA63814.1 hypothetical protein XK27_11075 [Streptococcus suis]